MIHYHGTPITPDVAAVPVLSAGHAFVSHAYLYNYQQVLDLCQSHAIDNGAFSAWTKGKPITDWSAFYEWAKSATRVPSCDFMVVPDVIGGTEDENDELIRQCPIPKHMMAPVWHLHESIERLMLLAMEFPRVCLGSSGEFSRPGSAAWNDRMRHVMRAVCDEQGRPWVKLHGLRMLNPKVFTRYPFASVDSTNIAHNIGIDQAWRGTYPPPTKASRAKVMRDRIENENAPVIWIDDEPPTPLRPDPAAPDL